MAAHAFAVVLVTEATKKATNASVRLFKRNNATRFCARPGRVGARGQSAMRLVVKAARSECGRVPEGPTAKTAKVNRWRSRHALLRYVFVECTLYDVCGRRVSILESRHELWDYDARHNCMIYVRFKSSISLALTTVLDPPASAYYIAISVRF